MGRLTVDVSVGMLRALLLEILANKQFRHDQFDCMTRCIDNVISHGNDDQKKLACRYILVIRTNLPYNSAARNILAYQEKMFRLRCAPLLNSLSAFLPSEYAIADTEDFLDEEPDPENSLAGSPVPF